MTKNATIDNEIRAAETAAQEAAAHAAELRSEQARIEQEAADLEERRRAEFEQYRQSTGVLKQFDAATRRAIESFYETVAAGGDYFAAYMDYRRAHQVARRESARSTEWALSRATAAHKRHVDQTRAFEERRLPLAAAVSEQRTLIDNSWSREARQRGIPDELVAAVSAFNAEVNKWAEAEGLDYRRAESDIGSEMHSVHIAGPRPTSSKFGSLRLAPPMSLGQMLQNALERFDVGVSRDHAAAVKRDLAAFSDAQEGK